jgi:glucokinase
MSETPCVLAADVGGTNLRVALVSAAGDTLQQSECPTPREGDAEELIEALSSTASKLIEGRSESMPRAFGVALAALVNPRNGTVYSSPNLPQLDGTEIARLVSERVGVPVIVENDATAAAIGEHWLGAAKGIDNVICLTIGTGVGGGLILDGRPYRGVGGTAGELGHLCVEPEGHPCGCGSRGCIEQYASATAIVRIASELQSERSSTLKSIPEFSARDVYNAAVKGDEVALATFSKMGRYLGAAIADLINALNPELIIIGGGGAGSWDQFIDHTWTEIRARAFSAPVDAVTIVRAALGGEAGLLGAAKVALDRTPA